MQSLRTVAFALALTPILSCSSDPNPAAALPVEAPDGSAPLPDPPKFGACPKYYATECGKMQVPLDHAHPEGETIDFHIARMKASVPAKRQVWLLSGGPGSAGESWFLVESELAKAMPDADIFVVDHRGTGYSHRLTCSQQDVESSDGGYFLAPEDVPACLKELKTEGDYDRLPFFTTAQAARDVALAIRATRAPDQQVYVWGASYGTHWAHRVMQVAPDLVDGIVFDGFLTPNQVSFVTDADKTYDEAGQVFLAGCTSDPSCKKRIGGDAAAKTNAVLASLNAKPCLDGKYVWRRSITALLDGWGSRALILPLVHRLERCSEDDKKAIQTMVARVNSTGGVVRGFGTPRVSNA